MEVRGEYHTLQGSVAYVESRGEGPAVLCLHSAGQSGRQWRDVLAELPEHGWAVYVPDLPGHGRSDIPPRGPVESIEHYAQWCRGLISALDLTPTIVVGCSIGGKIALQMAVDGPRQLDGVVAMAADGCNNALSETTLRRSVEDSSSPSRGDRTYLGTLEACGSSVPLDRAEMIARRHRCEDPVVSIMDLVAWTTHDLRERAAIIQCPVQLAFGSDDFWVREDDVRALAASIRVCRCEALAGVGHYPMEEVPGFPAMLHTWLGWLRENAPERAAS
jgi:pimeloyl-ACP methyl ester carboxylesterase